MQVPSRVSDFFGTGRGRQAAENGVGERSLLRFVQTGGLSCGAPHGPERRKDWRRMSTPVRDAPEHERDERISTARLLKQEKQRKRSKEKCQGLTSQMLVTRLGLADTQALTQVVAKTLETSMR